MINKEIKTTIINYGPQHPSSHGVLRMILELDGEIVRRNEPHIGQLHRGTEKLMESRTYLQNIPFMDRLDYVSPISYEHAWVLAAEKLLNLDVPIRAKYIRVLLLELSRINKHLFVIGTISMDAGAMTPLVWNSELREEILELFEEATGARFHHNYFRIGGVNSDISDEFLDKVDSWLSKFENKLKDSLDLILDNRIFKQRTVDIGVVDFNSALNFGYSGPNLRASGVPWDLRKSQPYEIYDTLDFDIVVGKHGDCYDRCLVRVSEIYESIKIIKQCLGNIPKGRFITDNNKITVPSKVNAKSSMEELIHHFKLFSEGVRIPKGEVYVPVETPSGEFGIYLVSDGTNRPYRVKLRSNGLAHLQSMKIITKNHQLADLPAILGSLDVIFGEIDR